MFTEAVLLLAAWLTVDHQVRHLHSNLGLFLNFLLLPDLKSDRKKQPLPAYTRWEKKGTKNKTASLRPQSTTVCATRHICSRHVRAGGSVTGPTCLLLPVVLLTHGPLGNVPGNFVPLKELLQSSCCQIKLQAVVLLVLQLQHMGLPIFTTLHYKRDGSKSVNLVSG